MLVTYPRPGTEHTSPALAIIDQRQLRLWLRVTRHRLLLGWYWRSLTGASIVTCERLTVNTVTPGTGHTQQVQGRAYSDTL